MFFYIYTLYLSYCGNTNYSKKDDITLEQYDYYV